MPDRHEPTHLPQSHLMEEASNTHAKGAAPQAIIAHESEQARYRRPAALHAEKNQDIEVENDETHRSVASHRTETVDKDETLVVAGSHSGPPAGTGRAGYIKFDGIAGEASITARPGTQAKYDGIDGERNLARHAGPGTARGVWDDTDIVHVVGASHQQSTTTSGTDPDDGPSTLIGSHEYFDRISAHDGGAHPFDATDAAGHGHAHPGHPQDGDAHLLHLDHAGLDSHLDSGADAAAHAFGQDGPHHSHEL